MGKRVIHAGDVFKNLYAGHSTYQIFIVIKNMGKYYHCIRFIDGKIETARFYTDDLQYDTEHFLLIGHIDLNSLVENALNEVLKEAK